MELRVGIVDNSKQKFRDLVFNSLANDVWEKLNRKKPKTKLCGILSFP